MSPNHRSPPWGSVGAVFGVFTVALQLLGGCGQTVEVGVDDALSTAGTAGTGAAGLGGSSSGAGGGGSSGAGAPPCELTLCRGKQYKCGDCEDNDLDGQIDAFDMDCLGPCDDDESALRTGLTLMDTAACRQDCYFDGDNGPGNDKCQWSQRCDPLSVAPDYPPSGDERCEHDPEGSVMGTACSSLLVEQQQGCLDACLPLVPNGCDCFGCCELPGGSSEFRFIGLGGSGEGCRLDTVDDAQSCPPCTPVPSCQNECEPCEVCVGRLASPGCEPSSGCPVGQDACDANTPCPFREYCVTGCCVPPPEPT